MVFSGSENYQIMVHIGVPLKRFSFFFCCFGSFCYFPPKVFFSQRIVNVVNGSSYSVSILWKASIKPNFSRNSKYNNLHFLSVSTVSVEAVLGRTAILPCDIEPEARDDRVYMVLWFRESAGKPLYRYVNHKIPFTNKSNDTHRLGNVWPKGYETNSTNETSIRITNNSLKLKSPNSH